MKAYPVPGTLKSEGGAAAGETRILKLTHQGFIAEVANNTLLPGEKFEITFQLPVLHHVVMEPIVIIKVYSQFAGGTGVASLSPGETSGPPASGVVRMIEAHFVTLNDHHRAVISQFLQTISATSTGAGKKG